MTPETRDILPQNALATHADPPAAPAQVEFRLATVPATTLFSAAILRKTARDSFGVFLLLGAAVVLFEVLYVRAMSQLAEEITSIWFKKEAIRRLIQTMVGADLAESVTATGLVTVGFGHPLLYAFTWTFLLATGTRIIAAEIERGTADLLLTLPVSRTTVYVSVSVVWIVAGPPMSFAPLLGVWLGQRWTPLWEPVALSRLALLCVNLLGLYLTIGATTMFVSSLVSRRARALGIVLAALLVSLVINLLTQFWRPIEHISFIGLLNYYRPLPIVRTGQWPVGDLLKLVVFAALFWSAGLWRFARRDIPAV